MFYSITEIVERIKKRNNQKSVLVGLDMAAKASGTVAGTVNAQLADRESLRTLLPSLLQQAQHDHRELLAQQDRVQASLPSSVRDALADVTAAIDKRAGLEATRASFQKDHEALLTKLRAAHGEIRQLENTRTMLEELQRVERYLYAPMRFDWHLTCLQRGGEERVVIEPFQCARRLQAASQDEDTARAARRRHARRYAP